MLCFCGRQPHSKAFFFLFVSLAALPERCSACNTQLQPTPMLGTAHGLQSCKAGNPNTERPLCFFKTGTETSFSYFPNIPMPHLYLSFKNNNKRSGQPGLSQGCLINSFHCSAWRMTNLLRAWRKTIQLMASRQSQSLSLWIHKEVRQREREEKKMGRRGSMLPDVQ